MNRYILKSRSQIYLLVSILITLVPLIIYFSVFNNELSSNSSDWSNFGSYLGGVVSAFLTFLTILLLIRSFDFQQETTVVNQFESTFFELFKLHKEITNRIEGEVKVYSYDGSYRIINYSGLEYFDAASKYLDYRFNDLDYITNRVEWKIDTGNKDEVKNQLQKDIDKIYDEFYEGKESELGHYFRSLYHILKFINDSKISNKSKYFDLLQAFLTDSELHVLFYNGIGRHGRKHLSGILENRAFLENIHPKGDEFETHFQNFYPETYKKYRKKPVHLVNK